MSRLKALIVEDTISNVVLLEAKLLNEHFEVHVAYNGLEGLTRFEDHPFDIVLLDVMMPGMDGFEVCRRLRAHPRSANIPIIMISALDSPPDRDTGMAAGADDFFVKPVEDEVLFARMHNLIRLRASALLQPAANG